MAEDVVAIYRLKFKDLASKGILKVAATARATSKAMNAAAVAMGGLAIGAGLAAVKIADAFADRADEINKFSRQVDISAESLQRLEFIANRQGASFENVKSGIEKFTKSMGEFRAGTGSLKTVLEKVDPQLAKQLLSIRNNSDAFDFAVKSLTKYKDTQKQAAVAAALFGRSGGASYIRIVDGGAEAFAKLNAEAERFRPAISAKDLALGEAYKDSIFNTSAVIKSLTDRLGVAMLPIMTQVADKFNEFVVANRELITLKVTAAFSGIAESLRNIDFQKLSTKAGEFKTRLVELKDKAKELIIRFGGLKTIGKTLLAVFVGAKIVSFIAALAPLAAILGGPILLAIGAVVAVGALLWKNWDTIKAKAESLGIDVDGVFAVIKAGAIILKDVFIMALKTMGTVAELSIQGIVGAFNLLRGGFDKSLAVAVKFRDGFLNVWDAVKLGVGLSINFMIDKINALLIQYNRIAASAVGSKIGLDQVNILQRVDVRRPAQDRIAATQAQTLRVAVDLSGKVAGAEEVEANVTSASLVNGRGGSNMPAGRSVVIP